MTRSVIVGAKRSPIGKFLGTLSGMTAPEFAAQVAKDVVESVGCPPGDIDWALLGQVLQAGVGQNPARQVALKAGLPPTITAVTVNQVCGSGLRAAMNADNNIRLDEAKIILTGGMESMSNAPHYIRRHRTGEKFGNGTLEDGMLSDGLTCPFEGWAMGCAAEYIAEKHGITREDQDRFAVRSHHLAAEAQKAGLFKDYITPIEVPGRKGQTIRFDQDETIRAEVTLDDLASLRPAFQKDGTVTAGNSSQLSDGAAMALLTSEEEAARRGWRPLARVLSHTTFGVEPKELFIAPVGAIRAAVNKAGLKLSDIDLFEINEAFAAQMVACVRQLELDEERVNVCGGGIALGHPIGASGTRVLVTLLNLMDRRDARYGVASLCLGGGNAVAMVLERVK
ncbi:MAG: acetyl-CoA C-acetyltransferase [Phycisphaerales bacterium]|nr:acetyl-CoA C-acetyltransferase [Phycisphaerales bacterium]MCB9864843.1 acetyl-CoA C-acetyltransferase [Phycisphaerales bacterium]